VQGESLDTGIVADFLRELNRSAYFHNVDLESTTRGRAKQGVKVVEFTVTAEMTNPVETAEKSGSDEKA
jgi:Tfp pilus assembly protein PilN